MKLLSLNCAGVTWWQSCVCGEQQVDCEISHHWSWHCGLAPTPAHLYTPDTGHWSQVNTWDTGHWPGTGGSVLLVRSKHWPLATESSSAAWPEVWSRVHTGAHHQHCSGLGSRSPGGRCHHCLRLTGRGGRGGHWEGFQDHCWWGERYQAVGHRWIWSWFRIQNRELGCRTFEKVSQWICSTNCIPIRIILYCNKFAIILQALCLCWQLDEDIICSGWRTQGVLCRHQHQALQSSPSRLELFAERIWRNWRKQRDNLSLCCAQLSCVWQSFIDKRVYPPSPTHLRK